jgi:hypothetical protein
MLLQKTRTIVSLEALVDTLDVVWRDRFGEAPEPIDAAMLFGKLCMECGWPSTTQSVWCWNLGNIRGTSPAGNYTTLGGAYEIVPKHAVPPGWHIVPNTFGAAVPEGSVCVLPLDMGSQKFRAYLSLREAVEDYVTVLGQHFGPALRELAEKGSSPEDFINLLKATHYFTGDVTTYRSTVASVAKSKLKYIESLLGKYASLRDVQVLEYFAEAKSIPLWERNEGEHTPIHLREPGDGVLDFRLPDLSGEDKS